MRSGAKAAIVGGVFVVVGTGVVYGGYQMLAGDDSSPGPHTKAAPVRTGPPRADEITKTAQAFFDAWSKGDATAASALTNNNAAAQTVLAAFHDEAHVDKVTITPGTATGATVPYTVKAEVAYEGKTAPLAYSSQLTVVRGVTTGKALVDWQPAVVHPKLKAGQKLVTGAAKNPEIEAVDHRGRVLTKEKYPSLGVVLDALRQKYGAKADGTPGVETWIEGGGADSTPNQTLLTLAKGKPGKLTTTLDADVQAAAEQAVKQFAESSVVAIEPTSGAIRAIADNRRDGFPASLQASIAPGSTMKIVTGAMIIQNGVGGANQKVECPATVPWEGYTFHNLKDFTIPGGTLTDAFARSCNTAFIKPVKPLTGKGVAGTALGQTARDYFGLGQNNWKLGGVKSFDGSVPESSGVETAASYIGQGKVQMSPLDMASVSATVINGGFRQPVIVPKDLDGRELATAKPLPDSLAAQLRQMMHAAAVNGTAVKAMAGVPGPKGAKTGSAEVDQQGKSNSWFTGYGNGLAAAALVQSGGHGGDAAGPIVARVLRAG
ncbi:penicillin-binding transpeptidase domain-containing protein [Streptomyces sp. TLI_146]|uniref:penicillin-binding transpeptidase domain-containing protein n=1 Tax=Streptomyces sp. TLI_146 TaxID=1938858 RepID=UPI000CB7E14D|nr:penicillin-binding transpeptidase domain-containing protein [Streptomyces sp. TLI_146]PKV86209.1 MecA-like transpeptidase family protein [Streptomyces sp. TLI_146]